MTRKCVDVPKNFYCMFEFRWMCYSVGPYFLHFPTPFPHFFFPRTTCWNIISCLSHYHITCLSLCNSLEVLAVFLLGSLSWSCAIKLSFITLMMTTRELNILIFLKKPIPVFSTFFQTFGDFGITWKLIFFHNPWQISRTAGKRSVWKILMKMFLIMVTTINTQ